MASVVIAGDTSGAITLAAPLVAGTNTITLPALTGTPVITGQSSAIVSGTAVASTSGTSIDFTSIPSWVKRITVMFQGVSTNGTSKVIVQLGDSGGVETSNYFGCATFADGSQSASDFSSGFIYSQRTGGTAAIRHGMMILTLVNSSTNAWAEMSTESSSDTVALTVGAGTKALSDTLDRVRITTVNGTDTFDLGTINILYE